MRAVDIIAKKRDKQELTRVEIEHFIRGYTAGPYAQRRVVFGHKCLANNLFSLFY